MGAHIAGYAGKYLDGKLGQITGLDPSGPYFEGLNNSKARLWHTDASLVVSIHTDAPQVKTDFGFGMYESCSHIDIYPNGGRQQPGCNSDRILTSITSDIINGFRNLISCDHNRAIDYYIESITWPKVAPIAFACNNFESFSNGKCIPKCTKKSLDCVIMGADGEQVINPGQYIGRKFFMITYKKPKFFRKLQLN